MESQTILTTEQEERAKKWYNNHKEHVDKISDPIVNKYPPTDTEDKNNPSIWKPEHWAWFLCKDLFKGLEDSPIFQPYDPLQIQEAISINNMFGSSFDSIFYE